jgi:WD40-like Beta Propeller Repeat
MRASAVLLTAFLSAVAFSCAGVHQTAPPPSTDGGMSIDMGGTAGAHASGGSGGEAGSGTGGTAGTGGMGGSPPPPLTDFPPSPIFADPTIPQTAPGLFTATSVRTGSAPCITSPQSSTLMPRNWLRPRFDYQSTAGENLFEVTLTVPGFNDSLRVYTRASSYTLDKPLWDQLRTSVNDVPIAVTVKALTLDTNGNVQLGVSETATTSFVVAPVDAPGKIVYWALGNNVGSLKGFGIGEEGTEDVLVPSQVQARNPKTETCIGCHAATPDGENVGFSLGQGLYLDSIADIRTATAGAVPSYVTTSALATVRALEGVPAYSAAHWSAGDRIAILSDVGDLHWIQLDGTAQGVLSRAGDGLMATEPTFSHDGKTIVYVSTSSIVDGRAAAGPADLYQVPYAARAGGAATPVVGAATSDYTEYYPAFSPDDAFVAFTRIAGNGNVYSNTDAEVLVVPSTGGQAIRLAANDAPACQTSLISPGLTNDWPRWSPDVGQANGKKYYWVTFSSMRSGPAQLYVTGVVVDAGGNIATFPALYLWNQPATDSNHTPSWDDFQIPSIMIN